MIAGFTDSVGAIVAAGTRSEVVLLNCLMIHNVKRGNGQVSHRGTKDSQRAQGVERLLCVLCFFNLCASVLNLLTHTTQLKVDVLRNK